MARIVRIAKCEGVPWLVVHGREGVKVQDGLPLENGSLGDEALRAADAVVVVTEWDEYRHEMAPEHVSGLTEGRVIVDGRNCLDAAAWRAAGWTYYGMGRP